MNDVRELFESVGIKVIECEPDGIVLEFPSGHKLTINAESTIEVSQGEYLYINVEKPEIDLMKSESV